MEKFIEDNRIHEGHRGRMRAKLLSHGQRIFDTYELLEMLLYQVVPYKDTNPIAKRLLYAFDGLDGVLRASPEELTKVSGVGERTARLISLVGGLSDIIGAEIVSGEEPDLSSYESVGEFFVDYFMGDEENSVVALFLDSSMRLISFKTLYNNVDYESGGVKPKAFIDQAVKSRAAVVISAHNHPFGPFYPSPGDRETHTFVTEALSISGFVHAEHYIVSGKKYAGIGSIQNFTAKLGQMPAVSQYLDSRNCSDNGTMLRTVDADKIKPRHSLEYENYNKQDLDYFVSLLEFVLDEDAGDTAVDLLKRYRTIENVFTASESELIAISGERCAFYLKLLAYVTARRHTEKFRLGCNYSEVQIADYLKALFLGDSVEKIYLLAFDKNGVLTDCRLMAEGTVTSSEVIPRKAVEAAVSASAASVSIAHNHPMGNPKASEDDLNITKMLANLFASCDIKLNSHYIIAGQLCSVISMEH